MIRSIRVQVVGEGLELVVVEIDQQSADARIPLGGFRPDARQHVVELLDRADGDLKHAVVLQVEDVEPVSGHQLVWEASLLPGHVTGLVEHETRLAACPERAFVQRQEIGRIVAAPGRRIERRAAVDAHRHVHDTAPDGSEAAAISAATASSVVG